jgi:hypothetical protein
MQQEIFAKGAGFGAKSGVAKKSLAMHDKTLAFSSG